jgi:hypothetical protein
MIDIEPGSFNICAEALTRTPLPTHDTRCSGGIMQVIPYTFTIIFETWSHEVT